MSSETNQQYRFGSFLLDVKQKVLTRNGDIVRLAPKALEILGLLVTNANKVVAKDELIRSVWPDSYVEEANLTVHISTLRKTLNGNSASVIIETFPKVGYRLAGDVQVTDRGLAASELVPLEETNLQARWPRGFASAKATAIAGVLLLMLLVGAFFAYRGLTYRTAPTPRLTRVPGTEDTAMIALSPTGEDVVHSETILGKRVLAITNVAGDQSVQLTQPDERNYFGSKFSRDGSFLYFVRSDGAGLVLERVPTKGGPTETVLQNVSESFSFSPDGSEFCFVRSLPDGSSAILAVNSDGSSEREIARRSKPGRYSQTEIAWSPDGKSIATLADSGAVGEGARLFRVDVGSGREESISDSKWAAGDGLAWLPDGSGLVACLMETSNSPTQVWIVPAEGGEPRKLTNDLENYGTVDVSADGKTILVGHFRDESSLWIQPEGRPNESRRITNEQHHNFNWVRWSGDSKLIFGSSENSSRDVWIMDPDRPDERQITSNAKNNIMPVTSPDGRFFFFCSNRAGKGAFNIYRADGDGQNVTQLTFGTGEIQPAISPAGDWLYYTSGSPDGDRLTKSVWKVSTSGGRPFQVGKQPSVGPAVSPDGNFIAFWTKQSDSQPWQVGIYRTSDGEQVRSLDIPQSNSIKWTRDGKGISFIKSVDGASNIWTQPIAEGQPFQETKYNSDGIGNFDWSKDGRLVCSRMGKMREAILITNFK